MSRKKKIGVVIVAILLIIALLGIVLKPLAYNYIEKKIKGELEKVDKLSIDSLHISILDRKLSLINSVYQTNNNSIKLSIKQLHLEGFSLYQLLIKKHLIIDRIKLIEPEFLQFGTIKHQTKKNRSSANLWEKVEKLTINRIEILDGMVDIMSNDSSLINSLGKINSQFIAISLNLTQNISLSQIEYKSFNLIVDSMLLFQNDIHFLKSKKIEIDNEKGLRINGFEFYPNEVYKSGAKKTDYRVNWTNIYVDSVQIKLDWDLLLKQQKIHATEIKINQLDYSSLLNKNYPRKEIKEKPLPHQMLEKIEIPFTVDSLFLVDSRFQYNEIKLGKSEKGKIYFTAFNAYIANVTNDSVSLSNNAKLQAHVTSMLMDQSVMTVNINYDLASAAGNHQISGNLSDFDLTTLNEIFLPLALIKFETGYLNKIDFNYYLNSEVSEGSLDFYYDDLKVIIYNNKNTSNQEFLGKIITRLANGLIIRKSNPLRGNYIKGEVAFEREKEKSFLTFWWKSLFSGMNSTIMRQEQI